MSLDIRSSVEHSCCVRQRRPRTRRSFSPTLSSLVSPHTLTPCASFVSFVASCPSPPTWPYAVAVPLYLHSVPQISISSTIFLQLLCFVVLCCVLLYGAVLCCVVVCCGLFCFAVVCVCVSCLSMCLNVRRVCVCMCDVFECVHMCGCVPQRNKNVVCERENDGQTVELIGERGSESE